MKKRLLIVTRVFCVFFLFFSTTIVEVGEVGIVTRFGAMQDTVLEPGLHFKIPLIEKIHKMSNQTQVISDTSTGMSKDKQSIEYDVSVNYRLIDPTYVYKNIGEEYADKIISKNVSDSMKNVLSTYDCESLTDNRGELSGLAKEELQKKINYTLNENEDVIKIESVQINNFEFSEKFAKAKEEKAIAQQELLEEQQRTLIIQEQANQKKIEAQGEADSEIIKAKGQDEANKIIQESLNDNTLKYKFLEEWDKKLPTVMGNGQSVMDITSLVD